MRKITLFIIACSVLFGSSSEAIYKKCIVCHGKKGEKRYLNKVPNLHESSKEERLELMLAYKNGTLLGGKGKFGMAGVMQTQFTGISEDEIKDLNDYIDTLK